MVAKLPQDADLELLLDCALAHKAENLRNFLTQIDMPRSGTREVLRERLREYLSADGQHTLALTEFLNRIEGWGNQHVYLYDGPSGLTGKWQDENYVKALLKANGLSRLFNRARPIVLPDQTTLSSIEWSPQRVRFTWNEKREWLERREDADKEEPEEGLIYRAFEEKKARGTLVFDWSLQTGAAMLMIQRLPTGTHYASIRDQMIKSLSPPVDLSTFDVVRVSQAIDPILRSGEVRERRTRWETTGGGRATFTSAGIEKDIRADATLRKMEAAGKGDILGSMANMYWLPKDGGPITGDFHTFLHRQDQRIGIMGEKAESEVRYVIERIRAHCP